MAYSGLFKPKHPEKYVGDPTNIVYRSSWEVKVMSWLDNNDSIITWASEELFIPYISPVDNRWHRYFPDFLVKFRTKDNKLKTMLWNGRIKVKPLLQSVVTMLPRLFWVLLF
jgi:hypothetical protein